jgi:hypothetical protein
LRAKNAARSCGSTFDPTASVAPIALIFQRFRGHSLPSFEAIFFRHSGAMRSIELWYAIAHLKNLEVPASPIRGATE